jgi:hypothetical protein
MLTWPTDTGADADHIIGACGTPGAATATGGCVLTEICEGGAAAAAAAGDDAGDVGEAPLRFAPVAVAGVASALLVAGAALAALAAVDVGAARAGGCGIALLGAIAALAATAALAAATAGAFTTTEAAGVAGATDDVLMLPC